LSYPASGATASSREQSDIPFSLLATEEVAPPNGSALAGKLPRLVEETAATRRVYLVLAAALVIGYFVSLQHYWVPASPGVDQNGYLVGGKMFARTGSTGFTPGNPYEFVGNMWIKAENGKYFPKYPVGLSVIDAVTLKLGGAKFGVPLTFLVNPVAIALALAATFWLLRLAIGSFAAMLGTLIVASSAVTLELTNNPNSHAVALCLVTWGMYLLMRWWQSNGLWRAIGAGLLIGSAVTIRYTEGLVILPLVIVALLNLRPRRGRSWIESAALLAAWAVPVGILVGYNWFSMHHLTGYDPTNESTGFSWENFAGNWETMLRQIYDAGLFFILPFSIMGLILMWRWNWRISLVLVAWIVPNLAVYSAYYWAPDTASIAYLRFFLTIFPALALAAVWCLKKLADLMVNEGSRFLPYLAVAMIAALGCGVSLNTALGEIERETTTNLMLQAASQQILKICPKGSVLFSESRILNFMQLAGDYELYDTQQFNRAVIRRYARIEDRMDQPSGLQPQRAAEMYDRLKNMSEADLVKEQNRLMVDAMDQGRRVFFIVPKKTLGQILRLLPRKSFTSRAVGGWDEPFEPRPGPKKPRQAPAILGHSTAWEILEVTAVKKK
jgi:hypothetical protein